MGSSGSSAALESEGEPSVVVAPARAAGVTLRPRNRKEETGQKGEQAGPGNPRIRLAGTGSRFPSGKRVTIFASAFN